MRNKQKPASKHAGAEKGWKRDGNKVHVGDDVKVFKSISQAKHYMRTGKDHERTSGH